MQIQVTSKDSAVTADVADFTHRLAKRRLARLGDRIRRVSITLSDVNGPKGGRDKRCQVTLSIAGQPNVISDAVTTDVNAAVDRSLMRARRRLDGRHKRRLSRRTNAVLPTTEDGE